MFFEMMNIIGGLARECFVFPLTGTIRVLQDRHYVNKLNNFLGVVLFENVITVTKGRWDSLKFWFCVII